MATKAATQSSSSAAGMQGAGHEYAIVVDGGRQYRVMAGQELEIDFRHQDDGSPLPAGSEVVFDEVLAVSKAGTLTLGATTTLQAVVDDQRVPTVLRELARRELPSTMRTLATVAGTVAAGGWQSELLAALLGQGQANQAATKARHKINGVCGDEVGRQHQIAFILAILFINQNDHTSGAQLGDDVLRAG